jgi:hypothetical protein
MRDIVISDYYHDLFSDLGEDGILFCLFRLLGHYKNPTYLNVCTHFTRKNGIRNLVDMFAFKNNTHARVESTLECMQTISFRFPHLDLLRVTLCDGVEYWLVKALIERGVRPTVICSDVNLYEKSLSVPYVPPSKRKDVLDRNYRGASIEAFRLFLDKHGYTYVGVCKYAALAYFVLQALVPKDVTFVKPNLDDFVGVRYARSIRWGHVAKKFWITIK